MMEQHLVTPEDWQRWLDALVEVPGRRPELDARASLLYERMRDAGEAGDLVGRAIERALDVERSLQVEVPIPRPALRPRRWWPIAAMALAAGLLVGLLLPEGWDTGQGSLRTRGELVAPGGSLVLSAGGEVLARVDPGTGLRPRLAVGKRPLELRWEPGDARGWTALAWTFGPDGQRRALDGSPGGFSRLQPGTAPVESEAPTTLVVYLFPAGSPGEAAVEAIKDGTGSSSLGAGAYIVAFDLVER